MWKLDKHVDKLWIDETLEFFALLMYSILTMSFTYQPKKRKRAKTHGFLVRSKSATGRNVLKRRRTKGRKKIAV